MLRKEQLYQIYSLDLLSIGLPSIAKAKIFIQKLWLLKLKWYDPLPDNVKR